MCDVNECSGCGAEHVESIVECSEVSCCTSSLDRADLSGDCG